MSERTNIRNPFFSIIMPSYNHGNFIESSIKSVLEQSFKDFELIIVDDASTDDSPSIIRFWQRQDSRIKAIFHSRNEGIAKTCNDGIAQARGQYVLMMASDDMLHKLCLQTVYDTLKRHKVDVIILNAMIIQDGRPKGLASDVYGRANFVRGDFFKILMQQYFVITGVFKRELIHKYNINYNERLRYLSDGLFWLELSAVAEFLYLIKPLYYYRIHGKNTHLSTHFRNFFREKEMLMNVIMRKYSNRLNEKERIRLMRSIVTLRMVNHNARMKNLACLLKLHLEDHSFASLLTFILFLIPIPSVALALMSLRFTRIARRLIWM